MPKGSPGCSGRFKGRWTWRNHLRASARRWPRPARWGWPTVPHDGPDGLPLMPNSAGLDLRLAVEAVGGPRFQRPLHAAVREARLLTTPPWVRSLSKLALEVR